MANDPKSYEPYRCTQIEVGRIYQDFIVDLFSSVFGWSLSVYSSRSWQMQVGETRQGVEIKHDKLYARKQNLYIELAEKAWPRPGAYFPSGICRDDNAWLYVIGDYDTVFVFAKNWLVALSKLARYRHVENGMKTSLGYLLPNEDALKYAAKVLYPRKGEVVSKNVKDMEALSRELHQGLLRDPKQLLLFET